MSQSEKTYSSEELVERYADNPEEDFAEDVADPEAECEQAVSEVESDLTEPRAHAHPLARLHASAQHPRRHPQLQLRAPPIDGRCRPVAQGTLERTLMLMRAQRVL